MLAKPTTVGQGIVKGGKGLALGIVSGVTGLVTQPYRGAQKAGPLGFVGGVLGGTVGLIAKPVTGVLDLVTSSAQGIRNVASGAEDIVARRRIQREIGPEKVITRYSAHRAMGQYLLLRCQVGATFF